MIKESSVSAASTLVDKLTSNNLTLNAIPGTPLAELVNQSLSFLDKGDIVAEAVSGFTSAATIASVSSTKDARGEVNHDQIMSTYVEAAIGTIRNNLKLARTVVNPMIKSVYDYTHQKIQEANIRLANPIDITVDSLEPIWSTVALTALVEKFNGVAVDDIKIQRFLPPASVEEIRGYLKIGSAVFDKDTEAHFANQSPEFLYNIYNDFFAKRVDALGDVYLVRQLVDYINPTASRDAVLSVFLIASHLKENIPDGVDIGLDEYRLYMATVIEQSARVINRILERRASQIKSNVLVLEYPIALPGYLYPGEGQIRVNGAIYDNWLESGGSPEVLFGAYVTGQLRNSLSAQSLLDNAPKFTEEWNRYHSLQVSKQKSLTIATIIEAISYSVAKIIKDLADDYVVVESRATYQDRLRVLVSDLQDTDVEEKALYGTIRKIVCKSIFAHTFAETILSEMDKIGEENPSLTVRESGAVAVIRVVSEWVGKLFAIQK